MPEDEDPKKTTRQRHQKRHLLEIDRVETYRPRGQPRRELAENDLRDVISVSYDMWCWDNKVY